VVLVLAGVLLRVQVVHLHIFRCIFIS
jgi:hypothetical protein